MTLYTFAAGTPAKADEVESSIKTAYYNAQNSGTLNFGNVNVTSTLTTITPSNSNRRTLLIRNYGFDLMYIGTSSLTAGSGIKLSQKESLKLFTSDAVYGITDSSTLNTRYLEVE